MWIKDILKNLLSHSSGDIIRKRFDIKKSQSTDKQADQLLSQGLDKILPFCFALTDYSSFFYNYQQLNEIQKFIIKKVSKNPYKEVERLLLKEKQDFNLKWAMEHSGEKTDSKKAPRKNRSKVA